MWRAACHTSLIETTPNLRPGAGEGRRRRRRHLLGAAIAIALAAAPLARAATGPATPTGTSPAASAGGPPTTRPETDPNPGALPLASVSLAPDHGLVPVAVDLNITGACDDLDPKACLLPFPNDRFTVADPTTDTGRRVAFDLLSMPKDMAGRPIDPTEWNRNDGFSPSSPILTYVPGLDLARTWGTTVPNIADLARYQRPDAPIVLLDATTGQRQPFWSELDQHPGTTDDDRLLQLRPASQLVEGHRYIVVLRDLRTADGGLVPATPLFQSYRDRTPAPPDSPADTEARRPHLEQLFRELQDVGIGRRDLFLTWDFTVASTRNLTERVLHLRDQTFAGLGDSNLADGKIAGRAPGFTVTKVQDLPTGATMRRVEGTVSVPNYLTPQAEVTTNLPAPIGDLGGAVKDAVDQLPPSLLSALGPVRSAIPVDPLDLLTHPLSVPLSRFSTLGSTDGLPTLDPLQPTVDVPFECDIARGSAKAPSHPALYGHGLLGSRDEVGGSSTVRLPRARLQPVRGGLVGPVVLRPARRGPHARRPEQLPQRGRPDAAGLPELPRPGPGPHAPRRVRHEPRLPGRPRAPAHPHRRALLRRQQPGRHHGRRPDRPRPRTSSVRCSGVAGMGYSMLLNRSVDWEGQYAAIFEAAYPDPIEPAAGVRPDADALGPRRGRPGTPSR